MCDIRANVRPALNIVWGCLYTLAYSKLQLYFDEQNCYFVFLFKKASVYFLYRVAYNSSIKFRTVGKLRNCWRTSRRF